MLCWKRFVGCLLTLLVALVASCQPTARREAKEVPQTPANRETATFGNGCFWCTEAVFLRLKGVDSAVSGYTGGSVAHPTYEEVCSETTGHAEAVRVVFDPAVISYSDLLAVFFETHDPTTLNRQGHDVGTRYRSVIFTHNDAQKQAAEKAIAALTEAKTFDAPIVTEIAPAAPFYSAEAYHQDYFARNPNAGYCRVVIQPKVEKLQKLFREKLK